MPPRTKFSGKRKLNALLTRMICATWRLVLRV
jgi:hypothetical protein